MREHEPKATSLDGFISGAHRLSRRGFLAFGTLAAVGCASSGVRTSRTPDLPDRVLQVPPPKPVVCPPVIPSKHSDLGVVLDRSVWSRGVPDRSKLNPMLPVRYITLHHDGLDAFLATDQYSTADRIELIRVGHRGRGWADIGYHYVVDRNGRVWEGRDMKWQGAHVQGRNEGNIGVLCLGNFELQSPSDKQLEATEQILSCLMQKHRVPPSRVLSHREWPDASTACPGKVLQREFVRMRRTELSRLAIPDDGTALV
jgi:hypothetical protein